MPSSLCGRRVEAGDQEATAIIQVRSDRDLDKGRRSEVVKK